MWRDIASGALVCGSLRARAAERAMARASARTFALACDAGLTGGAYGGGLGAGGLLVRTFQFPAYASSLSSLLHTSSLQCVK